MIRFSIRAFQLAFLSILLAGCGGDSKETASTSSGNNNKLITLNDLGMANNARNDQIEGGARGDDPRADDSRQDSGVRNPAGRNPAGRSPAGRSPIGDSSNLGDQGSDTKEEPNDVLVSTSSGNGLFPKSAMGAGEQSASSSSFGGALFPGMDMGDGEPSESDIVSSSDSAADGDNAGDTDVEDVEPQETVNISLLPDAKKLFQSHQESDAIKVVYVNHLVSDNARDEYPLSWFAGLKEPRLFFRWGVGVVYTKPRDFDGRHPVIGDPGDENEKPAGTTSRSGRGNSRSGRGRGSLGPGDITGSGGRGPSRARSGARTYKNIDTTRPDGCLMYYTGDFGLELISHLESRRKDKNPYYGQILKDVMEVEVEEGDSQSNNNPNSRRPSRGSASGSLGISGGGGDLTRGGGGRNPAGSQDDEENTDVLDRAMGRSTAALPEEDFTGSIIPGVELLGVGKKAELVQRAKDSGVDMLIMFTVKISKSRGNYFNTTNMKIVDINTEENVFNSKSLRDNKVEEAIEDGDDPVRDEVQKAFTSFADKELKAAKMPKGLNEENVKKRVGRLLKQEIGNPLPAAVEIVSFHRANLLSDDLAKMALERLFESEDSQVLVTGTAEERLEFLKEWLPEDSDS